VGKNYTSGGGGVGGLRGRAKREPAEAALWAMVKFWGEVPDGIKKATLHHKIIRKLYRHDSTVTLRTQGESDNCEK